MLVIMNVKIISQSNISMRLFLALFLSAIVAVIMVGCEGESGRVADVTILNVSYDPTREFYREFNEVFKKYWLEKTGQTVKIEQSHGGSGKQAEAVIDGLEADVVALALAYDIDRISRRKSLIPTNWQNRLPYNSSPYASTIVFLVRKGNPKSISDWDDLILPGVSTITPNPKASGGGRWNYLAAWIYGLRNFNGDEEKVRDFMASLFSNVAVFDSSARESTLKFVRGGIGDVLIAWENEALLVVNELGKDEFEIIYPSISVIAEPPVTLVDSYVRKHGTVEVSRAYIEYLYSRESQEVAAKHYYRPRNPEILVKYTNQFPDIELFTVDEVFGSWRNAQLVHFNKNGVFDRIFKPDQ